MTRIYYAKPSITELEIRFAADAVANGWGDKCQDYIHRFERDFAAHVGLKHAVATSSCTGALHMGLSALGLGPGDEVIIGEINWIGSIAPAIQLGATPVLVDVLPDSWCIDPAKVEFAITPRTKAVIAVHLYGSLCDMDALLSLGQKHGVHIIEDAAQAVGSLWRGRRAGSMGTFGAFSFHGTKSLSTGEGGMFVTQDSTLYDKVLTLSNQGRSRTQGKQFWPEVIGFKYKMSNVQAAIGCAQLARAEELVRRKAEIFRYYERGLRELPLRMNATPADTVSSYWMPTIVVNDEVDFDRDALLTAFREDGIEGRVFFWPLSMLPMFEDTPQNVVSYGLYRRGVNLPSYHDISETEMDRVIRIVRRSLKGDRLQDGFLPRNEAPQIRQRVDQPLVSVVTPFYDTAKYLARCIESVLGQSYRNFEYLLVNNCSTDGSLEIAERYAREDSRIRVLNNKTFLCQVDNYNGALLHISPESRYCKVVSADDWIFPNCLERMVAVAEAHPSAGIVGCHYLEGDDNFKGRRYPSPLMDGSTACRMHLIDCVPLFGSPTNLLMRSSIIRGRKPFYERDSHHYDTELCYAVLRDWDFGYAQEVLAFLRPPSADSVTGGHQELGTYHLSRLVRMRKYGWPWLFADKREYRRHYKGIEREYAASLITRLMVSRRRREVWQVHSRVLAQCGYKLSWYQVAAAALGRRLQRAWSASALATRS